MLPNTKAGEKCAYAIAYYYINRILFHYEPHAFDKAEQAAKQAIDYMARHLEASEALSYIHNFKLDQSEYWKSIDNTLPAKEK
jgi:hypothetical protein